MRLSLLRLLSIGVLVLAGQAVALADVSMSISFDETDLVDSTKIFEGTETVDLFLRFDATDGVNGLDAGEFLTGFTYGIVATNSGEAVPEFVKPITIVDLNPQMQSQMWTVNDQSHLAATNQLGGNVVSPTGTGVPFGSTVLSLTIDSSSLVAGDTITIDPNLFAIAAVSNGANDFGGNGNYLFANGILEVSAVKIPEPSSAIVVASVALTLTCRRRRTIS